MDARLPYIPETVTVHLGPPTSDAPNVTVPFVEYIANVASSEIYPTWDEDALRANILAIVSFALNRVYTEFYRSRGYDFDITNWAGARTHFDAGKSAFAKDFSRVLVKYNYENLPKAPKEYVIINDPTKQTITIVEKPREIITSALG